MQDTVSLSVYPRSWMAPFLAAYVESGHLDDAAARFRVRRNNVFLQVASCPEFARAFALAQREIAERIWLECRHRVRFQMMKGTVEGGRFED